MNSADTFKNKERLNNLNHFGSLVNLAFVDSEFSTEEFEMLSNFSLKLNLTTEERNMILDNPEYFTPSKIQPLSKRITYVYDFFRMIYADHRLDENEYLLVIKYVQQLGFNNVQAKKIVNRSVELFETDITEEDYEILVLKNSL